MATAREVFEKYDTDDSGSIEVGELDALLKQIAGQGFDEDTYITAIAQLRTADPSRVTWVEFATWLAGPGAALDHDEPVEVGLRELFDRFDADGNGSIDVGELRNMLAAAGVPADSEAAVLAIQSADGDSDGTMSFAEFVNWWGALHAPA